MSRTNKMLIDATHPEETRVVVVRDGRVEEFDFESASRKPLRGNIYLAKITRVEPSLQAAFVEYGGNRHGFLAFNEIHPDYYQIPMADRMALLEEEAAQEAAEEAEADAHAERLARRREGRDRGDRGGDRGGRGGRNGRHRADTNNGDGPTDGDTFASSDDAGPTDAGGYDEDGAPRHHGGEPASGDHTLARADTGDRDTGRGESAHGDDAGHHDSGHSDSGNDGGRAMPLAHGGDAIIREASPQTASDNAERSTHGAGSAEAHDDGRHDHGDAHHGDGSDDHDDGEGPVQLEPAPVEIDVIEPEGSEDLVEEVAQRPRRRMRSYKIQEVIKRRQVVLIQVVKEERGNKGAALTTYLSLAGRYTVLMPNTARGGGISRKITNPSDRKRLKAAAQELDVPEGMGLIVRTAGASRTAPEIKRDFEYLLRLWESVRDLTLESTAPTLVYEEGNLVKRSIRDLYNKDIDEIVVAGAAGYREAHDFMRMLTPSLAKNVIHYQGVEPLLARYRVEQQLAALFSPQVTLKSGGYIVINQTEALVAIDVNSGKSTREYSIEETALNTNLEAAEEVARQVKLRDLAGLIVIDFIDMEEKRNNRAVERRLKDSLRNDRARIQLGRISHFGLMEMSRQRLRTGVVEGSTSQCPHCQGSGIVRSIESIALAVLRGIEDALMGGTRMAITATTTAQVALYILNTKRGYIIDMEARHGLPIIVQGSDKLQGANFTIEKVAATIEPTRRRLANPVNMEWGFDGEAGDEPIVDDPAVEDIEADGPEEVGTEARSEGVAGGEGRRRRRRRGRRGRRDEPTSGRGDDYGTQPVGGYDGEEPAGEFNAADDGMDEPEAAGGFDGDADGDDDVGEASATGDRRPRPEGEEGDRRGRRGRRRGRRGGRRGGQNGERASVGADDAAMVSAAATGGVAYLEDGSLAMSAVTASVADAGMHHDDVGHAGAPAAAVERIETSHQARPSAAPVAAVPEHAAPTASVPPVEAAPVQVAPVQAVLVQPAPVRAVEVQPPVITEPVAPPPPRRAATSSEPVLERVIVGAEQQAKSDETSASPERPRRGWWQRKLGLE